MILDELGKLIEKHELLEESTEGVTVNANYVLPEKFWKRHTKLVDRAKQIQKSHNWSRKLLSWTAGDAERHEASLVIFMTSTQISSGQPA